MESLSRNRGQMGDLFIFAAWVLENAPMYNYSTHRSVAAGTPLQVVAGGRYILRDLPSKIVFAGTVRIAEG